MTEVRAKLKNLDVSPRKVRLVAGLIRGLSVNEAMAQLTLSPSRSSASLLKLLRSASANAKEQKLNPEQLVIKSVLVDKGQMLKRSLPRAQGRATPIQKKRSHVIITVVEAEKPLVSRFVFPQKAETKNKHVSEDKRPKSLRKEETTKVEKQPGFVKRVFRRKAI